MFQETKVNVEHVDEPKSIQKLELRLQKLNLKQGEKKGSSLKLDLEIQ